MGNWYYYDGNEQRRGPINDAQLTSLAARGIILQETILETETGQRGKAKQVPGLQFPVAVPTEKLPQLETPVPPPADRSSISYLLNRCYNIYKYCCIIAFAATILAPVTCFLTQYILVHKLELQSIARIIHTLVIGSYGILMVCFPFVLALNWFSFLYLSWSIIPEETARTTPNKAVGYCFIPFFSFYWNFTAIQGLAEDLNKSLADKGLEVRAREGLGTTISVLLCWAVFPYLNIIFGITTVLFSISYMKNVKEAAIQLAKARLNPDKKL
ncbi:MAG: hypothetical protein Q4G68_02300 [Planctomycetia bacterium]|nr:hypothetical protein [Planctomycetia bacterium]